MPTVKRHIRHMRDGRTAIVHEYQRVGAQATQADPLPPRVFSEPLYVGLNQQLPAGHSLDPDKGENGNEHGIYLTPRRKYAQMYGKHLHDVMVDIRRPKIVEGKHEISGRDLTKEDIDRLRAEGYDSIVVTSSTPDKASEVVVFDAANARVLHKSNKVKLVLAKGLAAKGTGPGQMGLFGGGDPKTTVKTHVRHTKGGKVALVVQHQRKTKAKTVDEQQWTERRANIIMGSMIQAERDRRVVERASATETAPAEEPAPAAPKRQYQRQPPSERVEFPVAALYVKPDGPYADLVSPENLYDEKRDATTYAGPLPVVAHPPCRAWGKLAWRTTGEDRHLALAAVADVRRWGGVLEHPVGSRLWEEAGIPAGEWDNPEREMDEFGGYTLRLQQWDYAHRGVKDTIIYVVGLADLPPMLAREGGTPYPVQNMSQPERLLSPYSFAHWLATAASTAVDGPTWRKRLGLPEPAGATPSTQAVRDMPVGAMHQFAQSVWQAELGELKPGTMTQDWGSRASGRGHGKRIKGAVLGAMAASPLGKRTYADWRGNLPAAEGEDLVGTVENPQARLLYYKGRAKGMPHDAAITLAVRWETDPIPFANS